jgi:TonB family protein
MPLLSKSSRQISLSFAVMGLFAMMVPFAVAKADSAPQIDLSAPNAQPYFPQTAQRAGEQGTAVVAVHVNAVGAPFKVQLDKTSGFDDLDKEAVTAVRGWHFQPAIRNGEAVSEWTSVGIRFDNTGAAQVPVSGEASSANADRNRVICRASKMRTGSNISASPTCMAKWQWDQREAYDQKTLQDAQGRAGMAAAPSHGH